MNIIGNGMVAATAFTLAVSPSFAPEETSVLSTQDFAVAQAAITSSIPTIDSSATALLVDGTKVPFIRSSPVGKSFECLFCTLPTKVVAYPQSMLPSSTPKGVTALGLAIDKTTGELVAVTFSQGGNVAARWREQQVKSGSPDRVDEITFVETGSPGFMEVQDSPYNVIKVAFLFDGIAIFPDNLFNLTATANATAGIFKLHTTGYKDVDLDDPDGKWVKQEGNTTLVVIVSDELPVIPKFFYDIGIGKVLDDIMRPGIMRAYDLEGRGFKPATGPVLVLDEKDPAFARFIPEPVQDVVSQQSAAAIEPEQSSELALPQGKKERMTISSEEPEITEPNQEPSGDDELPKVLDGESDDSDLELSNLDENDAELEAESETEPESQEAEEAEASEGGAVESIDEAADGESDDDPTDSDDSNSSGDSATE